MTTPDRWTHARSPRDLGRFVAQARRRHGLSQTALADELGLTRQYVSEVEGGDGNLYINRLFEIFDELDIEVRLRERSADADA
ncbi:UDP-N-acetylglucosamine 1-carboxyvinyltransferase/HTH-type transcriptional regulator/antitoxin HipB [Isoptericola jiangsuensis]|uniref:UDP-N-acetylglucosamine 1-carboxyvinyltransferase/HTH-type transcriptional regulator/antitoxin HipB n=1 Tax=Isoptericola jiangsuensis TaxID=548579 RepID=A0A2A9EXK9_9MICO|nr:helix-turn-helix domain-containing protein [Isoptericola jiangsuensis]PFG43241.1 UDP-N-acetylglucosamine 1-carboxyvinyltransferase/HTH-type transcriptional regulator/antitoxin HipB [Isoptericola jiangsuensis]